MRRVLLGLALAAVTVASTASADTFRSLPTAPANLPSASIPNQPGQIREPIPISARPAAPQALSFQQLVALWQSAGSSYSIPWEVLASINKIESNFGRNMGPSSAGAVGWMQFMPSTWDRWGLDANGDGVADPWNAEDAITAAARYLAASGGATDISRAVYSYNHAQWYVDEVLQLARLFGSGGAAATFSLDRLQVSLGHSRTAVVRANRRLVAAERVVKARWTHERALRIRAARATVLSDRLSLERRAAQAGLARTAAQGRVAKLRAAVTRAQTALASAQDRSLASSFA